MTPVHFFPHMSNLSDQPTNLFRELRDGNLKNHERWKCSIIDAPSFQHSTYHGIIFFHIFDFYPNFASHFFCLNQPIALKNDHGQLSLYYYINTKHFFFIQCNTCVDLTIN